MSYHGMRNWPPTWVAHYSNENLIGEYGVLTEVISDILRRNRCYLTMEHKNRACMGALLFDDETFCSLVSTILKENIGNSITQLGDLDLSDTL